MKTRILMWTLLALLISIPVTSYAEEQEQKQIQVTTKMNFPDSIPVGEPVDFTIDVTYKGPFGAVKNLEPNFEVIPSRAHYDVEIHYDDSVSDYTIWKEHIHTLHGTIQVTEDTLFETIFLFVSFEGVTRFDDTVVSVDPEGSTSLNIEKNPDSKAKRVSTPQVTLHMTDKDGNILSNAKLGEQIFFKIPTSNPFESTKQIDYLFHIIDNGEVIFLNHDTILLEGKENTDIIVPWTPSKTGTLVITFEQFHHNTDTNIGPVIASNIDIQEKILPPLKQIKSGIEPFDVICVDGLHLLLKPDEFKSPVCVTESTYDELVSRGWSVVGSWSEEK